MICKSQKTIFYSQQNIENMSNVPTNSFKKKKKTGSVCVRRQQHILIKLRQRQQKAGNVSGTKQKPLEELLIIILKNLTFWQKSPIKSNSWKSIQNFRQHCIKNRHVMGITAWAQEHLKSLCVIHHYIHKSNLRQKWKPVIRWKTWNSTWKTRMPPPLE